MSSDASTVPWLGLAVRFDRVDDVVVDVASGELFALGAEGIEQRDGPPFELVASFASDAPPESLVADVQSRLLALELPVAAVACEAWPDVDWSTHWRRHFRALSFGRVWVVPHWLPAPEDAEVVLRIDPGMAFGTGLHPTTALCLDRIVALSPIGTILDVGTGTGILAMAAAALGARAIGTDNDPVAVEQAIENVAANGLSERVDMRIDHAVDVPGTFDLVVANILAEPLTALAPTIAARVAPAGRLILSGIIEPQADSVTTAYAAQGLTALGATQRDEWVALEFGRPG